MKKTAILARFICVAILFVDGLERSPENDLSFCGQPMTRKQEEYA